MSSETLDRIRKQLDDMRSRVDRLRVQASLGKMELRDAVEDLRHRFEPAYDEARRMADEVVESGQRESQAVAKSLLAGWEELRRSYREYSKKAED